MELASAAYFLCPDVRYWETSATDLCLCVPKSTENAVKNMKKVVTLEPGSSSLLPESNPHDIKKDFQKWLEWQKKAWRKQREDRAKKQLDDQPASMLTPPRAATRFTSLAKCKRTLLADVQNTAQQLNISLNRAEVQPGQRKNKNKTELCQEIVAKQ